MNKTRWSVIRALFVMVQLTASFPALAGVETIVSARYEMPVNRYGHFALGRPHEYAVLVASTDQGRQLRLTLPATEVFEDLAPRVIKLGAATQVELLVIVSAQDTGSRLAVVELADGALKIGAQSAAIGTPMRWLNPVGVADLDGDGRSEIAAVITPHIGGVLKLYHSREGALVEIASMPGFSNHVYGTTELALSLPVTVEGHQRLLVPDATRSAFRLIGYENGHLVEMGRCKLAGLLLGPVRVSAASPAEVSVRLASGVQTIAPAACEK